MKKKTKEELLKELEVLKERLKELENEKNKSEAILCALGDGIIIQDTDYKIIYQNQVQNDLYGDRTGELCYRTYDGSDKICVECPVEKTFMDGKIHRSEKKVPTDKGYSYFDLTSSPLRDSTGKIIAGIKIVRDITAIKSAQDELHESEEKYRTLIENIQGGVFIIQDAKLQYINEAFARIAGYEGKEVIGKDFRDFIAPEDLELVTDYHSRRMAGENVPREYEFRVVCKDGRKIIVNMNVSLINYCGRAAIMGIILDITERKHAEELLREGERFMENIFESIQDGIGIIDTEMNIIRVNKTAETWYPHSAPFIGEKCFKAYHNRKERCELCPAWETLKTGRSAYNVIPKHGPGGKEVGWLEIYSYPLKDTTTGQMKGVIEYVRDITQRKRVEEELKQSEEKYRLLIHNIQEGVFIIQDAKMRFANETFAKITGYRREEIIGMDFRDFVAPEDLEMVQDRYYRRQKGEDIPQEYEFHMLHKGGEKTLVNMSVGIVTYLGRVASMGILKDITERKRAEKLIKQSEEKYRNLVELTTDIIYITDKDRKHVFMNDAGYRVLEALPQEVIGYHWSEWVYPDDREKSFKRFQEMIEKGIDVFEFENRYLSKSGRVINVLHNVRLLRNGEGEVIGVQGIARDITERKRQEESLRLFSETVESAPDGVQIIDLDGRIIYSNKAVGKIYGFSHDELIGKKVEELNVDPEIAGKVIIPCIKEKGSWAGELRVKGKGAKEFFIWLNASIIKKNSGEPLAMVGIIRDITERKKEEKALLESETRYRTLFETAGDAIFILETRGDEEGQIMAANSAAAKMHGYSMNELLTMNIDDLDTRESSRDAQDLIKRILNGETIKSELDHRRKDGTVFPVEICAGLLEIGDHKYILAFDRDITERKRAQEALRLSNLVVENSQTVLFRWKAQDGWPVEFVSNNVVQFGYHAEDFLSGTLLYASIIYPDDLERVSNEVQGHSQRGDDRFQQEYRIIAKNGSIHWIDDRTVIERSRDGQITHYQGIVIDITERKHIEEDIKKYNKELEESNSMKELFTDIMHHDLLNPLNVANGYIELFLEDELEPQKKSYLETIKRNLIKGMELIDNATKLSKIESMKYIEFEDMDLKMVIGEAIDNLRPLAVKAGMSIENNIQGSMLARANTIIEDVFTNLISNAIKYAPQGKRIVVDGSDGGDVWLMKVIDFGAGIKETDKKLIFKRFHREEKKGIKGSGLGLAIAVKIVELHNGRIWVEDNPEGGAVFVVEIPKR